MLTGTTQNMQQITQEDIIVDLQGSHKVALLKVMLNISSQIIDEILKNTNWKIKQQWTPCK